MGDEQLGTFEWLWFAVGGGCLLLWLVRTRLGRLAFADAPRRLCTWSLQNVLILCGVYLLATATLMAAFSGNAQDGPAHISNWTCLAMLISQAVTAVAILIAARLRFGRALNPLGLSLHRVGLTVGWSLIYFVIFTGLTLATLVLTVQLCAFFGYPIVEKHKFLEILQEKQQWKTVAFLTLSAAVAAPLQEELFFRCLLQRFLIGILARSRQDQSTKPLNIETIGEVNATGGTQVTYQPNHTAEDPVPTTVRWLGIVIIAAIFAMFHTWQHWPALFVFGLCLGYAYERHGNLLIPILVHCWFNSLMLMATLMSSG